MPPKKAVVRVEKPIKKLRTVGLLPDTVLLTICSYCFYTTTGEVFIEFVKAHLFRFKYEGCEVAKSVCFHPLHGIVSVVDSNCRWVMTYKYGILEGSTWLYLSGRLFAIFTYTDGKKQGWHSLRSRTTVSRIYVDGSEWRGCKRCSPHGDDCSICAADERCVVCLQGQHISVFTKPPTPEKWTIHSPTNWNIITYCSVCHNKRSHLGPCVICCDGKSTIEVLKNKFAGSMISPPNNPHLIPRKDVDRLLRSGKKVDVEYRSR